MTLRLPCNIAQLPCGGPRQFVGNRPVGAATGGSILMLLAVYLANRVLAKRLGHPARVLPTRFPLVSLLGVVGMAVAGGLIGYAAGFWEK